jgi:hypothetical protein
MQQLILWIGNAILWVMSPIVKAYSFVLSAIKNSPPQHTIKA